jgi:hypothetical protein
MPNPYTSCPTFDTEHFHLRLVRQSDAADLLKCYRDPKAQALFNDDNCNTNFQFTSENYLEDYIKSWIEAYENHHFVRFAIVDKSTNKAVGTIEMFEKGVLRVDICSEYEQPKYLDPLFTLCVREFFPLFNAKQMLHKAVPAATHRIEILQKLGFKPVDIPDRPHAFILNKPETL